MLRDKTKPSIQPFSVDSLKQGQKQDAQEDTKEQGQKRGWEKKQSKGILSKDSLDESKEESEPSLILYNLQKLLAQSSEREEKCISFIKEQKEQLHTITEKYVSTLAKYEREIKQFISKKESEKQAKRFEKVHRLLNKPPPNQYNKVEYTTESDCELNCKIRFLYIIPIVEDYLKDEFPSKLCIELNQYLPEPKTLSYNVQFNPEIDREEVLDRIKNGYSIEVYLTDLTHATYSFVLTHFMDKFEPDKMIKFIKQNDLQFNISSSQSGLVMGYGKVNLEQLLYFNLENEENWVTKVPIVAHSNSDKIIAFLHVEMSNSSAPKAVSRQHIHKVSKPIALNRQQLKFHTDKESRLLQRINQYKNVHNSVIPSAGGDVGDRNIMLHQRRKELEEIQHYKEANKNQYMSRVFDEAIEQFHTDFVEMGSCKYIPFLYTNRTDRHQKAKIQLSFCPLDQENTKAETDTTKQSRKEAISVQIVEPALASSLMQQRIIDWSQKVQNCTIDYALENDYAFVVSGESIVVFVRIICHSDSEAKYQVQLQVRNDFGEMLHSDMVILRTSPPIPSHSFKIYTFAGETNEYKLEVPCYVPVRPNFSMIGKTKTVNVVSNESAVQFETFWGENYEILQLRAMSQPGMVAGRIYCNYLLVYDTAYTKRLACFEFIFDCVQKIGDHRIDIGRTETFALKVKIPPTDLKAPSKQIVRVDSSNYLKNNCSLYSAVSKSREFTIEPNTEHTVVINYNTFDDDPRVDKLIVNCSDALSNKCLKKYALVLRKNQSKFKHVYRVVCRQDSENIFNFELFCNLKEQTTYKLYSSNSSLMLIDEETIVMFTGQERQVKLRFNYWNNFDGILFSNESSQRTVVLAVDDGKTCTLYLFELVEDSS